MPLACRAVLGLGASFGAGPITFRTIDRAGDRDRGCLSVESVFQRNRQIVPQVGTTARALLASATAHEIAEQIFEDIRKGRAKVTTATLAAHSAGKGVVAILVVGCFLLIIFQDVIGFVDFLEVFFGLGVILVRIRVQLTRFAAVGLFDFVRRGPFRDAQHIVEITF